MYVKATDKFKINSVYPVELGFIPNEGYIFEVSEDRYQVLSGNNKLGIIFVEEVKAPEPIHKTKGKDENKIAVIIPNYNYADWLERCLTSVLEQTYKRFEIVFVDDMSTDNSVQIARKMLQKPHKVIRLKQKRYNGGARNEAYLHISKDVDYIAYLDSDDWFTDKYVLERINGQLKYNPDVLFIGIMEHFKGEYRPCKIPLYKDKYEAMQGWSGSGGKVIAKALATRQDCLYPEGTLKEDKNQHFRVCIRMRDFICLPDALYVWNRDNANSITTVREKRKWGTSTIRHWADTLELYLTEQGRDNVIDAMLRERIELVKREVLSGGDRQY